MYSIKRINEDSSKYLGLFFVIKNSRDVAASLLSGGLAGLDLLKNIGRFEQFGHDLIFTEVVKDQKDS